MERTFVLVHGGQHGGWCWRKVRRLLQRTGADVFTPTLTGLGERAHLLHPSIDLETHIADVINCILCEELSNVVLVGHSYGGMVITGVADRIADKLSRLIYLDALVPRDGQSLEDLMGGSHDLMRLHPTGILSVSGYTFGVTALEDVAWVKRRVTPQSIMTLTQRLQLSNPPPDVPRDYISCTEDRLHPALAAVATSTAVVRDDRAWVVHEMQTGHDAMITEPEELAGLLLKIAEG